MRVLYFIFALLASVGIAYATSHAVFNGTTANQQPVIQSQTQSFTIIAGNTKTISITAIGATPLFYQFFKNGVSQGAPSNTSTFITAILTQADNGAIYTAKVTNSFGLTTSTPIQATVNTDITINVQPQTQTVTAPTPATFTVAATGNAPLTCQWYKNGVLIPLATSCTTYTTPATAPTDSGSAFTVVFMDAYSSLHSNPGILTINAPSSNITFIANSFGSSNVTSGATCTANVPSSTQTNDVELAFLSSSPDATPGIPAGWFLITAATNGSASSSFLYYHIYAASGEPTSYSFTGLSSPECLISTYRNVNINGPIDAFAICSSKFPTTTISCTIPALTATAGANETYIGFWDYILTTGITGPAALTQRFSDTTQRSFWSGDIPVNGTGVIPAAQTATASSASTWEGIGVTLISATSITNNFVVSSPVALSTINGIITAQGVSGSTWVNVSAFDANNNKVALADNTPTQGHWTLQIDTTKLVNSPTGTCPGTPSTCTTIKYVASSVPSGQSGGTSVSQTLGYVVNNTGPAIFTVSNPVAGATVSGSASPASGTCGAQWTGVQALFGSTALSSIAPCTSGAWSLSYNTTLMPNNSTQSVTFQATATGFNPAVVQVSVNIQQPTTTAYDNFGLSLTPAFPNVAVPAEAFLQSIGFDFWNSSYNTSQAQAMLTYIGARWIRGVGGPVKDGDYPGFFAIVNAMNNANPNLHFKYVYMLFSGCYADSDFAGGNSPPAGNELYNIVQDFNRGIIKHVEIGNEVANDYVCWNGVHYGGGYAPRQGSYNGYTQMMAHIHAAMQANSTIAGKVALSTSNYSLGAWDQGCQAWGLKMPTPQCPGVSGNAPGPQPAGTVFADILSAHNYLDISGGDIRHSGVFGTATNNEWEGGHRNYPGHISFYNNFGCQSPGDTFSPPCSDTQHNTDYLAATGVTTEGGNAVTTYDGNNNPCTIVQDGHTEQANQILNKYIEGFTSCGVGTGGTAACNKGISAQAYYDLQDNDGGYCNFQGLFHAGTAWPAATSLHNMTTLLNDVGTSFVYGSTTWTITGCYTGGRNANISSCHGLLLQKNNGHFWLLQTFDWDGHSSTNVTVNFGQTFANVNVYDPVTGTGTIGTANGTSSYNYTNNNGHPRFFELW